MTVDRKSVVLSLLVVLVLAMCVQSAVADLQWTLQSVSGPAPRTQHGMVWDSCRNVVVLHGGLADPTHRFGDTWEWDGNAWTLRTTAGLGQRLGQAMAFDSDRCVTVAFGGVDGAGNYMNDTWEWDGTNWTQKCTSGCVSPGTRNSASMTYDTAHRVVVLFGGYAPGLLNDTWTWDGTSWTQITTNTPPSPRSGAAIGYDPVRQRTVLFGGNLVPVICGTFSNETWELDLSTSPAAWTQITTTPHPSPRGENAHLVYDPSANRMLLFGGTDFCSTTFNDTWEYVAGTWTQIPTPTAPQGRHGHDMVYDTIRHEVVMFGGDRGPLSNWDVAGDTWTFGGPVELCDVLGKPHGLDIDLYVFQGSAGEQVTVGLAAGSTWGNNRATLVVTNIGVAPPCCWAYRMDCGVLPNELSLTLPCDGCYLVIVAEQPRGYRGPYCVTLDSSGGAESTFAHWTPGACAGRGGEVKIAFEATNSLLKPARIGASPALPIGYVRELDKNGDGKVDAADIDEMLMEATKPE